MRGAHTEPTAPTHLPGDCDLGGKSFSAGVPGPALLPGSTKLSGLRRSERIHSSTAGPGQRLDGGVWGGIGTQWDIVFAAVVWTQNQPLAWPL